MNQSLSWRADACFGGAPVGGFSFLQSKDERIIARVLYLRGSFNPSNMASIQLHSSVLAASLLVHWTPDQSIRDDPDMQLMLSRIVFKDLERSLLKHLGKRCPSKILSQYQRHLRPRETQ
ncbi:hypothetical protein NQZ68_020669 [Dissostichus eleginoides]|nr:hypothetical protein NQZ68_020669 [Dissostichus eleginoides]